MSAELVQAGLQALLAELEAIDLSRQDRDRLTRGIQEMMLLPSQLESSRPRR